MCSKTNETQNELTIDTNELGDKLWDEITKSIADHMPNQLLPLFKEAFGKEYPKGTSIQLIQTEYPVPDKQDKGRLTSIYSDIMLIVNGCDLYHLECQMDNDNYMVVRMIEYDFYMALRHGVHMDAPNIFTLYFPHSTVLYPDVNSNLPDQLICNVIFPDGSQHSYNVPTMKIQSYTLEDIRNKHLTMFIPFKLLSFRPRLNSVKNPINKNELTDYINQLIVILYEEYQLGNISNNEYKDYIGLINLAAKRVFHKMDYLEEVYNVTKSVLVLPSDLYREADRAKELEKELKKKESVIQEKESVIQRLIEKDNAEIDRLRQLLKEAGIDPEEK